MLSSVDGRGSRFSSSTAGVVSGVGEAAGSVEEAVCSDNSSEDVDSPVTVSSVLGSEEVPGC